MPQYTKSLNEQFSREQFTVGWPWRLFMFSLIVFLAVLLIYLGLAFGYKTFLNKSINELQTEIDGLIREVRPTEQENFLDFYSQIVNLRKLLNDHLFTSQSLSFLESATNRKVVYGAMSLSTQERSMTLEGFAESYDLLAAQLALYEQAPVVEKVILENSSLSDKVIKFTVRLLFKEDMFVYKLPLERFQTP